MNNVLDAARGILETTSARWQHLVQALPDDLLRAQPAPGEWSPLECLQHLLDTEEVFQFRVQCLLDGRDFPAFDPDTEGTQGDAPDASPTELVAQFDDLRMAGLRKLAEVTPGDLALRVQHAELGPVTLSELIHEWAAHDLNHTIQAEQALMQPFIRGCGPWQPYFTAHDILHK
jgi:hypothetical protein